jgi:hypothetical protein
VPNAEDPEAAIPPKPASRQTSVVVVAAAVVLTMTGAALLAVAGTGTDAAVGTALFRRSAGSRQSSKFADGIFDRSSATVMIFVLSSSSISDFKDLTPPFEVALTFLRFRIQRFYKSLLNLFIQLFRWHPP